MVRYVINICNVKMKDVGLMHYSLTTQRGCLTWKKKGEKIFIFRWPCISLQSFANDQLDALFYIFVYYTSLHVWSFTVFIIRRSNCINTSSGMISLCEWPLGMPVRRELQFPPDRRAKRSLTQTNHTRWCINTIRSPDDEHCDARNM